LKASLNAIQPGAKRIIGSFHLQAGCHTRLKHETLGFSLFVYLVLYCLSVYWCIFAFVALGLISSLPCLTIGWEERLWNDPFLCWLGCT